MEIGAALGSLGTGIATMFVNILTAIVTVFFKVGENGAITIEPLGYLLFISLALSVVYFLFRWVASLFRARGR